MCYVSSGLGWGVKDVLLVKVKVGGLLRCLGIGIVRFGYLFGRGIVGSLYGMGGGDRVVVIFRVVDVGIGLGRLEFGLVVGCS